MSVLTKERKIEVPIGLHEEDGVELEIFTRQLLAVRIRGQAERVRTSLLTKEQALRLRAALDELIGEMCPTLSAGSDAEECVGLKAA